MKIQPRKKRARQRATKSHKYESVPDALIKVGLYLPVDVRMVDLEWDEPVKLERAAKVRAVHPAAMSPDEYRRWAEKGREQLTSNRKPGPSSGRPTLPAVDVDRLCADPVALRKFLEEKQKQIEAFEPWRKQKFADLGGALSGGAR